MNQAFMFWECSCQDEPSTDLISVQPLGTNMAAVGCACYALVRCDLLVFGRVCFPEPRDSWNPLLYKFNFLRIELRSTTLKGLVERRLATKGGKQRVETYFCIFANGFGGL